MGHQEDLDGESPWTILHHKSNSSEKEYTRVRQNLKRRMMVGTGLSVLLQLASFRNRVLADHQHKVPDLPWQERSKQQN